MYISEEKKSFHLSFNFNDKKIEFISETFRKVYTDSINWLFANGYKFDEIVKGRELIKKSDVPKNYIGHGVHYIPNSEYAILVNFGIDQSVRYLKIMLSRFGATDIQINVDDTKVVKFSEMENSPSNSTEEVEGEEVEDELTKEEPVINPFKQSICILGSSGKGKSTTVELMLEQLEKIEDSEFEFIIPTSSTTGLLSQYSPKGKYIKSRLGRMIMTAHEHPEKMVTAVFDECHKSAVIEMINDELLQCISTRRNMGRRFISVDEETEELYPGLAKHRGNLLIPNNFGFIFLSSKPDVIIQNSDFFNRVDIYVLTEKPPKGADLSLNYDEKENVILPEYFTKIEGKSKEDEDRIKSLYNNIKS